MVEEKVSLKMKQYWELNEGSTLPPVVWETFKATTRGRHISAIKVVRSEMSSQVHQLQDGESKAAETFSDSPTPDHFSQLADARRALFLHLASATHLELGSLAGGIFEFGDKNSELLANLAADSKMADSRCQKFVARMAGLSLNQSKYYMSLGPFPKSFIKRPLVALVSSLKHTCNPNAYPFSRRKILSTWIEILLLKK